MAKSKFELALQETENQRQILNAHNISEQVSGAALTDSLPNAVSKTMQLTNPDKEDVYVPDSYFAQLEIDFANDPLRSVNGGDYAYCTYIVITAAYDTSYLSGLSATNALVVFSDDTTFTGAATYTKVWDNSKDLIDGTGRKVRLIKRYGSSGSSPLPCYATSTVISGSSPLLFFVTDLTVFGGNSSSTTSATVNNITECRLLEYAIFTVNINTSEYNFYGNTGLKCVKFNTVNLKSTTSGSGTSYLFYNCLTLKYVYANYLRFTSGPFWQTTIFNNCPSVKQIPTILPETSTKSYSGSITNGACYSIKNFNIDPSVLILTGNMFNGSGIETITINSTIVTMFSTTFTGMTHLKQLNLYNDFNMSGISLATCYSLTKNCLNNIIYNLKDRTAEEAGTMIFGPTNLAKLTAAEIAVATNKNWTLS